MTHAVYLDHNATTPVRPAAAEAVAAALAETGNPSSVHGAGRRARARLEAAREEIARAFGARPAEVVFTSGGSEANNLALISHAGPLIVSAIEHPSVLEATSAATVPVNGDGVIDLNALDRLLNMRADGHRTVLVSVMLANNETGVLQPLAAVVEAARKYRALVHCDAVQAAGRFPVDFAELGVDMMSVSAHKLGGPQGVGALIVRDGLHVAPMIRGGGQERGRRAGTENVAGIAGFAAAAAEAVSALDAFQELAVLRDEIEKHVIAIAPEARLFGAGVRRVANTSCFAVPGLASDTQVISLDLAGVLVSAGAACSSGKVEPSHVLAAMDADADTAGSAIRVSLGWTTTESDVDAFIEAWKALYQRRRAEAA